VRQENKSLPKTQKQSSKLIGINFQGFGSSAFQNRITPVPPFKYIEDSFKIFSKNGIRAVRVPFYWEPWEYDKSNCCDDLISIGKAGDKYGIMCLYDNHQWECSSWLGQGIGMPNSLISTLYEMKTGQIPNHSIKKDFWNRWWDREIKTVDGVDGWDAQLDYLKNIVKLLKDRKSTMGFEILNEPEVFRRQDYCKVGNYHEYMVNELRKITDKPLFFSWVLSHTIIDNPFLQTKVAPVTRSNIIYDGHAYPPSFFRVLYFRVIALLMRNITLYIGEFNSGFEKGTILTQKQIFRYIKRLNNFLNYGWALWRWSYIPDLNIPAFNLARIEDNRIQKGIYFKYFVKAINEINS
jgi:hypothetical protein